MKHINTIVRDTRNAIANGGVPLNVSPGNDPSGASRRQATHGRGEPGGSKPPREKHVYNRRYKAVDGTPAKRYMGGVVWTGHKIATHFGLLNRWIKQNWLIEVEE